MRPLTNDERKVMRHALGLTNGREAYRNRFASTGRNETWEGLCGIGAANRETSTDSPLWWYWVTSAGLRAVIEQGEIVGRETKFDCAN